MTPVVEAVLGDPGSPAVGPPRRSAAVTVVLFTDYQCPICKATDPALQALIDEQPDVRVVFKDWPIFGDISKLAARTALAAATQGKYRAVHQALMASRGRLDAPFVEPLARQAGADWRKLTQVQIAEHDALESQLRKHAFQAFSLGLQGTPAYIVGPSLFEGGLDKGHLDRAISGARRSGPL